MLGAALLVTFGLWFLLRPQSAQRYAIDTTRKMRDLPWLGGAYDWVRSPRYRTYLRVSGLICVILGLALIYAATSA